MASVEQRALNLAYAGAAPQDIAQFLGISKSTVLTYLADLSFDGATQEQRILSFVRGGHHPDEIAVWMGVSISTVFQYIADTGVEPAAGWMPSSVLQGSSIRSIGSFNGSTDGTAINAALTALGGPGLVFLPGGTAGIDTTILPGTGQHLIGQGIGATILKLNNGVNQDVIGNAGGRAGGSSAGNDHISIRNLTVDGNKTGQNQDGTKYGIHTVRVTNEIFQNVEVQNVDGFGLSFDGQGTVTRGHELTNIIVHDNTQAGYLGTFASRNVVATNIYAYSNGTHGVEIDHSEGKYTNVDSRSNGSRGIWVRNVFGSVYNNLHATLNGQDGIFIQGMTASMGDNWFAANNSTSVSGTYHDINFSGDNTLSYGITTSSVVNNIQANPNGNFGVTTEGYCLYVGDPTTGNFGDLKLFNVLVGTGTAGAFRTPASAGGLVIVDWPGSTQNLRWWLGSGLATPNGFKLGTSATHTIGFLGATPVAQQTGGAKTAAATYSTNEQTMLQTVYNALRSFGLLS